MTDDYNAYLTWANQQTYKGQPIKPYSRKQWDTMSPINKHGIMLAVNRTR